MSSYKLNAIDYLYNKAYADRDKALMSLNILLDHPSGIGDHSTEDLYSNLEEALSALADAEDRLETLEEYFHCIKDKQLHSAIHILYNIHDYGYSVIDILDCFICFVKQTNILSEDAKYEIIPFLCKYITVFHNIHEDGIELALFTNNLYALFHS